MGGILLHPATNLVCFVVAVTGTETFLLSARKDEAGSLASDCESFVIGMNYM